MKILNIKLSVNVKSVILFLSTLALLSCTEEVDIDLDSTYTRLVVEGIITTDTTAHMVKLSTTADYFSNDITPKVTNAMVSIFDGDDTVTLTESSPGIYLTPDTYFGVPGKTYTLNIELEEMINDTYFYTASETMTEGIPIDSINVQFYPYTPFDAWTVQLFALEPPTTNFYSFYIRKNDVLLTDTLTEVSTSDDRFFNGNYINAVDVYFLIGLKADEIISIGDNISLEMANISGDYFNFLSQLQEASSGFNNPLFSGPPSNVASNISNNGMGYFAAYGLSRAETEYIGIGN